MDRELPPVRGDTARPHDRQWVSDTHLVALNAVAIALHVASGVLGAVVSADQDQKVGVTAPFVKFVDVAAGVTSYIKPAPRTLFSVFVLWPNVAVEFVTAAFHVVYLTMLLVPAVDRFVQRVVGTTSRNGLRWVEYSITATLMSAFGLIGLGVNDFYLFLKMLTTGVALQFCGFCIELLDHNDKRDRKLFTVLWWVLGTNLNLANTAILLTQAFGSDLGSAMTLFYQNIAPFALWFQTFGIIAQLEFKRWCQFGLDVNFAEKYYILLSLSTKLATFWLGYGTFRKILEERQAAPVLGVSWDAVRYCAMVLPAVALVIYAISDARAWNAYTNHINQADRSGRRRYHHQHDANYYGRGVTGNAYHAAAFNGMLRAR